MEEQPKTTVLILTFNKDTLELGIDAPDMPLDFALSQLKRALAMLENHEKLLLSQQLRASAQEEANNVARTRNVLSKLKM